MALAWGRHGRGGIVFVGEDERIRVKKEAFFVEGQVLVIDLGVRIVAMRAGCAAIGHWDFGS